MAEPDVWLRGRVPDVPALLQPVAHALLQAVEDVERASEELRPADLWVAPGGAATAGFHLKHLAGSTDRLFAYARGESLTAAQRDALAAESVAGPAGATVASLIADFRRVVDGAMKQLGATPIEYLTTPRLIGQAQRHSTVLGCLFHAGEHAARHAGQFVSTVRFLNR